MSVLYGKCFGIGNAVMSVPAIKALRSLAMVSRLDVLVGTGPDDIGAMNVMFGLKKRGIIDSLYMNHAEGEHDVAIMAIPFDGRWRNGIHFNAKKVVDGRSRPDPSTQGLSSWGNHEVVYQMENVWEMEPLIGTPDCSFMDRPKHAERTLYLGLGYKKDHAGFWKVKHWGNTRYIEFLSHLFKKDPDVRVVTTGDAADYSQTIKPIMEAVSNPRFAYVPTTNLTDSFKEVGKATMYFGNDTGMMHVAASFGMITFGLFFLENSMTKNSPWCGESHTLYDPEKKQLPSDLAEETLEVLDAIG